MRWARYRVEGAVTYGVVEGEPGAEQVEDVRGDPFSGHDRTGRRHRLGDVKLLAPVIPRTFYAAGLNYVEHVKEQAASRGQAPSFPPEADIGYRANNALIGPDEPIVIPRDASDEVEYEAELVVVIGREAKHLSPADALSCVLGYTIGNDVSERSWQAEDRTLWRAKNCDTFKPMGPWVQTDFDPAAARTKVRLNGHECIDFKTDAMIHGVVDYLVAITRYMTLEPGDVLWMGTEGHAEQMKPGDVVEVEITGIGTLRNPVVAAAG
jgi:2-keto-4-pentenoate hydratase/2-oxohepta-3-ene-1,7-dioic acid hydratase in catechol pathway